MKRLLTLAESAEYCGVGITVFKRWMREGIIAPKNMPVAKNLFDKEQLDDLINRTEVRGCGKEGREGQVQSIDRKADASIYLKHRPIQPARAERLQPEQQTAKRQKLSAEEFCRKWSGAYQPARQKQQ